MSNYISGRSGTGKTRKMLEEAKKMNAVIVCNNPSAMSNKANNYGIFGLKIVGYNDVNSFDNEYIMIDEISDFFKYYFGVNLASFTMTVD